MPTTPLTDAPLRRSGPRRRLALAAAAVAVGTAPWALAISGSAGATPAPTAPPPLTVLTHGPGTGPDTGGDYFITPTGDTGTYANGPEIVDGSGKVVWFHAVPAGLTASDFRAQTYHGHTVLTWWQGTGLGGLSNGTDYIDDPTADRSPRSTPATVRPPTGTSS